MAALFLVGIALMVGGLGSVLTGLIRRRKLPTHLGGLSIVLGLIVAAMAVSAG